LNFKGYQKAQQRTWNVDWPIEEQRNNAFFGLAGEAGEIAEYRKKTRYHGHEFNIIVLRDELGDLLHYISAVASLYGLSLDAIAQANVDKLWKRYPNGFTREDSIARRDTQP